MSAGPPLDERVEALARALGFDAVGFAAAEPTPGTRYLQEWLDQGYAGEMDYLARRAADRIDPRRVLPEARSVIVLGLLLPGSDDASEPATAESEAASRAQLARYAGGDDYHEVLLDRARALEAALPELAGRPLRSRSYVDTGPVSERALAVAAGLGWIGKNGCLIDPERGSHLMLGVILTELELTPASPVADHCGSCRACLDACPTDAFPKPYVVDASRCLSYTTIELRGSIPEALREGQGDRVFGCDVCQDVCPWNRSRPRSAPADPLGLRSRLVQRPAWRRPTLDWLLSLAEDEASYLEGTRGTALRRPKREGLVRNALVAAGNSGDARLRPRLQRIAESADPVLREHARWALARLAESGAAP